MTTPCLTPGSLSNLSDDVAFSVRYTILSHLSLQTWLGHVLLARVERTIGRRLVAKHDQRLNCGIRRSVIDARGDIEHISGFELQIPAYNELGLRCAMLPHPQSVGQETQRATAVVVVHHDGQLHGRSIVNVMRLLLCAFGTMPHLSARKRNDVEWDGPK